MTSKTITTIPCHHSPEKAGAPCVGNTLTSFGLLSAVTIREILSDNGGEIPLQSNTTSARQTGNPKFQLP